MPELTPLDDNRQEHFLNGEDLEPITRREHFYAGRESELPAGHQEPETREEWFIQKYRGGGGDVTVVPLSVTENGTYSEEGKAYSPVNVNVPLPQNAYLLKSVNTPTPIASFNDGEEMVMPSIKVAIEPQQEGSGDPSPTNIRPISGWDKVDVSIVGDNCGDCADIPEPQTANIWNKVNLPYNKYTISFDVVNAVRTALGNTAIGAIYDGITNTNILLDKIYSVEDGSTYQSKGANVSGRFYFTYTGKIQSIGWFWRGNSYQSLSSGSIENIMIEVGDNPTKQYEPYNGHTYTIDLDGTYYGGEVDVVNGIVTPAPYYASYNGETLTGEWISDRDKYEVGTTPTIGAQVVNIGASGTPVSIQPTAVKSLRGVNNVYANTGKIKDAEYFSKEV